MFCNGSAIPIRPVTYPTSHPRWTERCFQHGYNTSEKGFARSVRKLPANWYYRYNRRTATNDIVDINSFRNDRSCVSEDLMTNWRWLLPIADDMHMSMCLRCWVGASVVRPVHWSPAFLVIPTPRKCYPYKVLLLSLAVFVWPFFLVSQFIFVFSSNFKCNACKWMVIVVTLAATIARSK